MRKPKRVAPLSGRAHDPYVSGRARYTVSTQQGKTTTDAHQTSSSKGYTPRMSVTRSKLPFFSHFRDYKDQFLDTEEVR